jgi:hypothetical protein
LEGGQGVRLARIGMHVYTRSNAICTITISNYNELRRLFAKTPRFGGCCLVNLKRLAILGSDLEWGIEVCDGN